MWLLACRAVPRRTSMLTVFRTRVVSQVGLTSSSCLPHPTTNKITYGWSKFDGGWMRRRNDPNFPRGHGSSGVQFAGWLVTGTASSPCSPVSVVRRKHTIDMVRVRQEVVGAFQFCLCVALRVREGGGGARKCIQRKWRSLALLYA